MPINTTHETIEKRVERTSYECDVDDCGFESDHQEDLNQIVLNPQKKSAKTKYESPYKSAGAAILCDHHAREATRVLRQHFDLGLGGDLLDISGVNFSTPFNTKNIEEVEFR